MMNKISRINISPADFASLAISEPARGTLFGDEEIQAVISFMSDSEASLNRHEVIEKFESEFSAFTNAPHSISVSSCTAGLRLLTLALGLRQGTEVIIQANAFWNTTASLIERGIKPVVVDTESGSLNIDVSKIQAAITGKTKAILFYSHGGIPADVRTLRQIADANGILLLEDAAHSLGASIGGVPVGSLADATVFSFSSLKNISTLGEGGMVVTLHQDIADRVRKLRNCFPLGDFSERPDNQLIYPEFEDIYERINSSVLNPGDALSRRWYQINEVGTKYLMTSIQALVGSIQLKRLNELIAIRSRIAKRYTDWANDYEFLSPIIPSYSDTPSHHLFNLQFRTGMANIRQVFFRRLSEKYNLHLRARYWPIHLTSMFRTLGYKRGDFPSYEACYFERLFPLPISPTMPTALQEEVISRLTLCLNESFVRKI